VHQAAKLAEALIRVAGITAGLAVSSGSLPTAGFMTHITCRLTAKKRDQLRNPTLGNRVWATFTFDNYNDTSVTRAMFRATVDGRVVNYRPSAPVRRLKCGQQTSTCFADNTMFDLPWRNFPFYRVWDVVPEIPVTLQHRVG